jgi:hypothetical protein
MVKSPLPHYMHCTQHVQPRDELQHLPEKSTTAVMLPLPEIKGASGEAEALGQISGVAVDPFDGSIWLLVRCGTAL